MNQTHATPADPRGHSDSARPSPPLANSPDAVEPLPFPDAVGTVITFYSYKGGVGRSMALANVAALLARDGHRVLVVDWDLEAPGIEKYFRDTDERYRPGAALNATSGQGSRNRPEPAESLHPSVRATTRGMVDLITTWRTLTSGVEDARAIATGLYERQTLPSSLSWELCVAKCRPFFDGGEVHVITAGRDVPTYVKDVQSLDWNQLFDRHHIALYFERLRDEWKAAYDFVFIDSRTGLSDTGSICTALLPDQLVVLFTANEQSVNGILTAVAGARAAQATLSVPRAGMLVVPVPSRDEPFTEKELSDRWRAIYAQKFADIYAEWAVLPARSPTDDPEEIPPARILNRLFIPYASYWSYGERLPVLDPAERENPAKIGAAYARLATLIASGLEWSALEGQQSQAARDVDRARSQAEEAQARAQHAQAQAEKKREELEAKLRAQRRVGGGRWLSTAAFVGVFVGLISLYFLARSMFFSTAPIKPPDNGGSITPTPADPLDAKFLRVEVAQDESAITQVKELHAELRPDSASSENLTRLRVATMDYADRLNAAGKFDAAAEVWSLQLERTERPDERLLLTTRIAGSLYKMGRLPEAISRWEQAIEMMKKHPPMTPSITSMTRESLVVAYEQNKQIDQARSTWNEIIDSACGGGEPKPVAKPDPKQAAEPESAQDVAPDSDDCLRARTSFARFLIRTGDFDAARKECLIALDAIGQPKLLESPDSFDFKAAFSRPATAGVLRVVETLMRAGNDQKQAEIIAGHIRAVESVSNNADSPAQAFPNQRNQPPASAR